MLILGISAFYHDSAAALLRDGKIIAAAQEERFTRKKHDAQFPENAISYCLEEAGCTIDQVDQVVFYEKPFLKFERLMETYVGNAPRGFQSFRRAIPVWIKEKLFQKSLLGKELKALNGNKKWDGKLLFTEHHQSHGASAFFPSPFESAAVLTMDGVGEWCTTSIGHGKGNSLEIIRELHFPHSLGLLYSAFTYYTGFRVNSGEYKIMGLAPYGNPKYVDLIRDNVIDVKEDGSIWLDQSYFNYATGLTMTSKKFHDLFGGPPRQPEAKLTQKEMDLAASIQVVTEEIVLKLARTARDITGEKNLCLAGGVALNCVANGKLLRSGIFENIWIQPAAGDAGGALGAAYAAWYQFQKQPRPKLNGARDWMEGTYLGPKFETEDTKRRLDAIGAEYIVLDDDELITRAADALADQRALGWMQGRMEFGPRALGGRSILGDPRSPSMQKVLNLKVKYRESFRPFAPSVLREDVGEWFEYDTDSPYMLMVADVAKSRHKMMTDQENALFGIEKLNIARSEIPAVTHVDYSARIQTVHNDTNPRYWSLISAFKERTGCPVVVNTSFNVRGEPIVCTPDDAFRCFMGTEMDNLAIGNCWLIKEDQDKSLAQNYEEEFELD
ncbi:MULTISPECIES: carbamoyltransferase [Halocynthiibacter]|uniref:Carbamoyltransferase n=1 Tax=Halocynthiibacter halioticoli TaxID=2986804 RepID=A0AAE3J425_9RHOB|nr:MULTISPECIES: carbamoyltransferase [Halocynthiibacter]MCV6825437.1 carbamoyltransferase [Halocynthiibacter halioticoli]MCW4058438.1 carbamoyltransferase [Halocynthiibacter sp. SDUM655004]